MYFVTKIINVFITFIVFKYIFMDFAKNQQNSWYENKEKMFVAVDCIIFGFDNETLKLLVFKREIEPLKGSWSLIGSFVRDDESANQAAMRILKDVTGLENVFMEELETYSDVDRDPGARCINRLTTLYEQIFQKKIDPRNFRKKILSLNFLKKTEIKDKSSSKKGAYLYEFDDQKNTQQNFMIK